MPFPSERPDILAWLVRENPCLQPWEKKLRDDGWTTLNTLRGLTPEQMHQYGIDKPGHRAALVYGVRELKQNPNRIDNDRN